MDESPEYFHFPCPTCKGMTDLEGKPCTWCVATDLRRRVLRMEDGERRARYLGQVLAEGK